MRARHDDRTADYVIIAIAVVSVLVGGAYGIVQLQTDRACIAAGYPSSKVTVLFERYCVKRVDQTDQVVPAP